MAQSLFGRPPRRCLRAIAVSASPARPTANGSTACAACPNCGYADNPLVGRLRLAGDRVLIVRSAFALRRPRRWEVIAFRRPEAGYPLCVKRVVGLPGESIEIRNGDVFADGRIQRKTLSQQRAMAVLVYDANYPPLDAQARHARAARTLAGRRRRRRLDGRQRPIHSRRRLHRQAIDWLVYHHLRRLSGQSGGFAPSPVTDLCGYDQGRPRREEDVHAVPDLLLGLRLAKAVGQGLLLLRAKDGREEFVAELDPVQGRYRVLHNGRPIPGAAGNWRLPREGLRIEVSLFDQQFLLAMGGTTVGAWPYNRVYGAGNASAPPERAAPPSPPDRPLAIGVVGLKAVVEDVQVHREVYYTAPVCAARRRSGRAAGSGRILCLGR